MSLLETSTGTQQKNAIHTATPTQHKAQHSNQASGEGRNVMNCTNSESAAGISECSYRKLNEYAPLLTHEANNGNSP